MRCEKVPGDKLQETLGEKPGWVAMISGAWKNLVNGPIGIAAPVVGKMEKMMLCVEVVKLASSLLTRASVAQSHRYSRWAGAGAGFPNIVTIIHTLVCECI